MFIEELQNKSYKVNSKGGLYYGTTFDSNLDLFTMASRFMSKDRLINLFDLAFTEDKILATSILLYNLDIRNGKGERRIFKILFKNLCLQDSELSRKVLALIPSLGRYDYLFEAYQTPVWDEALTMIKNQLNADLGCENPSLLAKWMPSLRTHNKDNPFAKKLCKALGYSEREYRKILSNLRSKLNIVEKKLTEKDYCINYEHIPSLAMIKYRDAFIKYDKVNFDSYLTDLRVGKRKVNTKGLAPHEMVRAILRHDRDTTIIDQMWESQEDFLEGDHRNILVVADTSGSMTQPNYLPLSAAIGLAIYTATHNSGIFNNKFLSFSEHPKLHQLKGNKLSQIIKSIDCDDWEMNTNIDAAMNLILKASIKSPSDCPSHLLIISDMEFDECTSGKSNFCYWKSRYQKANIEMPKIIFWNVAADIHGVPVTKNEADVCMVSGFSPAIFTGILEADKISPIDVMLSCINPYLNLLN